MVHVVLRGVRRHVGRLFGGAAVAQMVTGGLSVAVRRVLGLGGTINYGKGLRPDLRDPRMLDRFGALVKYAREEGK